jgi:hypothetical protein
MFTGGKESRRRKVVNFLNDPWGAWEQLRQMYIGETEQQLNDPWVVGNPFRQETIILNEWEMKEEMSVTSVGGLFDQFIALATERWQAGVDEYRDGDESRPFDGDPLQEAMEEAADLYAYSKVANEQKLISDTESDMLNVHAYEAYKIIVRIRQANKEKGK